MPKPGLQPDPSWRALDLPADWPPTLVVVVDTEEEFDWNAPLDSNSRSTTNILCQPMAQEIMDRYGVVPTYVVDYPVADTPEAVSVLRAIAEDGRCEIGAHLHPWVSPPYEEPVNDFHSFPGNLAPALEHEKLARLAERIEVAFGARPSIYKAGRYGLGPATFATLQELGFRVDTSVMPHTDFSDREGPDFTGFPAGPFQARPALQALPLSVHFAGALAAAGPVLYPALAAEPGAPLRLPCDRRQAGAAGTAASLPGKPRPCRHEAPNTRSAGPGRSLFHADLSQLDALAWRHGLRPRRRRANGLFGAARGVLPILRERMRGADAPS